MYGYLAGGAGAHLGGVLVQEALHEDVHVQRAQEPAAEAGAEGGAALLAQRDAGVVERELVHGARQPLEALLAHGVDPCMHTGIIIVVGGHIFRVLDVYLLRNSTF